jgi:hypothetical protein
MRKKSKPVIDFDRVGGRVYIGRPNGEMAREHFDVHQYDVDSDAVVEVRIPDNARTMSSSFFLGMFGESVTLAGSKDRFEQRFVFKASEHINNQINDAINRALVSIHFVSH